MCEITYGRRLILFWGVGSIMMCTVFCKLLLYTLIYCFEKLKKKGSFKSKFNYLCFPKCHQTIFKAVFRPL